jgi:hypothetical protein
MNEINFMLQLMPRGSFTGKWNFSADNSRYLPLQASEV